MTVTVADPGAGDYVPTHDGDIERSPRGLAIPEATTVQLDRDTRQLVEQFAARRYPEAAPPLAVLVGMLVAAGSVATRALRVRSWAEELADLGHES
jgi:hypothetical protein